MADLLLQKNRVLEAQQILDLLKVQEVDDYLQNVRGNQETAQGIELLSPEEIFWENYYKIQNQAIVLGKELTKLRQIPEGEITAKQEQEIAEIEKNLEIILAQIQEFIYSQEVAELMENLNQMAQSQKLGLAALSHLQKFLLESKNNRAVLLYPLVLEDSLELVLVTANAPPLHKTVAVKREDFHREIARFLGGLTNRSRAELLSKQVNQKVRDDRVTKSALQLYEWLIKPLENYLKIVNAKTIIYAPDGQLRYIPLAGLYDGEKWLVERFKVNNITAASLINFDRKSNVKTRVLGGGLSEVNYDFEVGNQKFTFNALPFASPEINSLANLFPETTKLLGNAFTRQAIIPQMNQYNIVHLATHAAFVRGKPEDSFILFGDGERVTLRDVENWNLKNVDLVVLSACQTGVGGILGNGAEILGFGYMMQQAGSLATLASLWRVDDEATQKLMQAFYTQLQSGNISKVEALRQAQISLINDNYKGRHPYYWAAFILIGNGLSY